MNGACVRIRTGGAFMRPHLRVPACGAGSRRGGDSTRFRLLRGIDRIWCGPSQVKNAAGQAMLFLHALALCTVLSLHCSRRVSIELDIV